MCPYQAEKHWLDHKSSDRSGKSPIDQRHTEKSTDTGKVQPVQKYTDAITHRIRKIAKSSEMSVEDCFF